MKDCADCDEPIDLKRLAAKPTARLCIGCQKASEDNGNFVRSKIVTTQNIEGWSFVGQVDLLVLGDN